MLLALLLVAVGVPLLVTALFQIPGVQNFAADKAVRYLGGKLQTEVSIGRVEIGLFRRIRLRDLYVADYGGDTLLYAARVDAYVSSFGLGGGGIVLSRGQIDGAVLRLREMPDGEMNIRQIVARLSNPDKQREGRFRLTIRRALVRDMAFSLERRGKPARPYGIDFADLRLEGLNLAASDFAIDGPSIGADIEALSARERSGFVLDRLAGRFVLTSGVLALDDATLLTPRSNLSFDHLYLVGNSWSDYKYFTSEILIEAAMRGAALAASDVAYFVPSLRDVDVTLTDADITLRGSVDDFEASIRRLGAGGAATLAAGVRVKGLPDISRTDFDVDLRRLSTSGPSLASLLRDATGRTLPASAAAMLRRAGRLDASGRFRGSPAEFRAEADLWSELGSVKGVVAVAASDGSRSVKGSAATYGFRLGDLLGRRDLVGDASVAASIDGTLGRGATDAAVSATVTRLGFKGYVYDTLRLDGRLGDRAFDGRVEARDPNLDFDFVGDVAIEDSIPRCDFRMDLRRADLARLHINPRDTLSVLSARIAANASGRSLDDLNGRIEVMDASYRYNDKQLATDRLVVLGENSAASKYVELRSDFVDATFRSKTSYRTVFEYLRRSAWRYLPMLGRAGRRMPGEEPGRAVADDYSLLSVDVKDFNPVADAVSAGLQIADGSTLRLLFNPASDQLSLRAESEYVERNRLLATNLNVNASNRSDSLVCYLTAEDLYAGGLHLPHLSLTGGARAGRVQVSVGFEDSLRNASGLVGLRAGITDEHGPDGRVIGLRVLPSYIRQGGKTWHLAAQRIRIDTARIEIDRFTVYHKGQQLLVDGVASRDRRDSLRLQLRDFELAPLAQFARRMGYRIEGRTNGEAVMNSVLRGGEFTADIAFDSLSVNGLVAPPLRLASRWDFARNRAGVYVTDRQRRDTLIRGYYAPDRKRYYARLSVPRLDLGLLDPVLAGVVSSTRGTAGVDLVLRGQGRDAHLGGSVSVEGLTTTVDFTQVTYTVPRAVLKVDDSRFSASDVAVYDPEGHTGRLAIDLDLRHLSNIAYDVRITPDAMLVLDTDEADNDQFYGRIYATGRARIAGDKGQVAMDIAAATDGASTFSMPLSGRSNISYADFVVFEKPVSKDTLSTVALKKQAFERRRRERAAGGSRMSISLALDVGEDVEVELTVSGNPVRVRGAGTLNMQIDPRSNVFEMYGDYTISEGSYNFSLQNILNKRFIIEGGSMIQWTGAPTDAMLDIDAVYKLKASLQPLLQGTSDNLSTDRSVPVECVIHLGGRLSNPDISFDVRVPGTDPETQMLIANALATPETVDTQFASLLLFNSFMAENNESSSNFGASVSAATGLELVSNMITNWLSSDDYNIIIRYRPKSEQSSDEWDFGLSKSLIDNRLFVELEGNYLVDNKQAVNDAASNFMGEAYITYLIDRSGSLRLKAFTQTIDRFDENQGLQETGLGIYYKEDFNNWRDLRRRIRDRFTNKKRKACREARRAERAAAAADAGDNRYTDDPDIESEEPPEYE